MPGGVRRVLVATSAVVAIALLAGCGIVAQPVVTVLPTDGAAPPASAPAPSNSVVPGTPTAAPESPASDAACGGAPVVLDAGSTSLVISGDCPDVQVNGTGLQIDASAADVETLTLSGERLVVSLGRGGQVTVRGNDARITASEVGSLTVQGDRNTLTATGPVGAVTFRGNDNAVRAASVGQVSDEGDRNTTG